MFLFPFYFNAKFWNSEETPTTTFGKIQISIYGKVFSLSDYKSMKAPWILGLLCILLLTSRRCPSGASCRGRDAAEKKKEEEELTKVVDEGT